MLALAVEERFAELTELLYDHGWVIPGRVVTHQEIADYLRPFTDPIQTDSFHFTRRWMQRVAGKASELSSPEMKTARALQLPAEYVMIFRVLGGSVGILAQLDAELPFMQLVRTWRPGFTEERTAS
jgi:hypothetical protein